MNDLDVIQRYEKKLKKLKAEYEQNRITKLKKGFPMNSEMKRIIEYASTLGIVELPPPRWSFIANGTYYGLPGFVDTAWIIRVHNNEKEMDIVKVAYINNDYEIMTTQAVDYTTLNYKFHLKKLVNKIRKLELDVKKLKENARIEKMEKDFND